MNLEARKAKLRPLVLSKRTSKSVRHAFISDSNCCVTQRSHATAPHKTLPALSSIGFKGIEPHRSSIFPRAALAGHRRSPGSLRGHKFHRSAARTCSNVARCSIGQSPGCLITEIERARRRFRASSRKGKHGTDRWVGEEPVGTAWA